MNNRQPDTRRIGQLLLTRWYIVIAVALFVMGVAFGYTKMVEPTFEAEAHVTYNVQPRDDTSTGNAFPRSGDRAADMETLKGWATSPEVVQAVAAQVGGDEGSVRGSAKVLVDGNSSNLVITAKASIAAEAATLAQTYAEVFSASRNSIAKTSLDDQIVILETEIKKLKGDANAGQRSVLAVQLQEIKRKQASGVDQALVAGTSSVPGTPVWPNTIIIVGAAFIVGIGLGIGAALIVASFDSKVREDELDQLPLPVSVKVPFAQNAEDGRPLSPSQSDPAVHDAFAAMGARLMLDSKEDGAFSILVTSAQESEGKSSVAANLATSLAGSGRRVVLVDGDMRRPTQEIIFPALAHRPGLSQVLTGQADVEQALTLVSPNLAAIGAGPTHQHASSLVASLGFHTMLERLAGISTVIVVDAPPVIPVTDALALAPHVDHIVVCARLGRSMVGDVDDAVHRLSMAATTPQSLVLVGAESPRRYGYEYQQDAGSGGVSAA